MDAARSASRFAQNAAQCISRPRDVPVPMRSCLVPLLSALLLAPLLATAQPASAPAADASAPGPLPRPVQKLYVDVPPYYLSGDKFNAPATVHVDPDWDKLLSSAKRADIRQAEQGIGAKPELVKPQTFIVLAMRLYDVGLRDDAVFWYYVGRSRFVTMEAVLDMRSLQLAQSAQTVQRFVRAAEPAMDGYALCSVARQQEIRDRAIAWVADHPYQVLGYAELPAASDDRNAALVAAVEHLRDEAKQDKALMSDPAAVAALDAHRALTHDHERFCW